jgi:HTH-type transcriptional regulator / antitoxin HigA
MMKASLKPVRNDEDHTFAVARIEALWGATDGTAEGDELEALAVLVDAYEKMRWPLANLDPIETLIAHMDLNSYSQADLAQVLSSTSRASEILNRKRALNLAMIRAISVAWGLPVSLLVSEYKLAA